MGLPPGKNHGQLCFLLHPLRRPLPTFLFLVRASETLVFLPAKRLECGPLDRGLVAAIVSSRLKTAEASRTKVRNL